ncbi:MAG: SpoIIE family protein phosphatase, partial [archaeon]|nr:SpoIIE family protein phosphatase [archaeon]
MTDVHDDLYREAFKRNEIRANQLAATALVAWALIGIVWIAINSFSSVYMESHRVDLLVTSIFAKMAVAGVFFAIPDKGAPWIRYLLLATTIGCTYVLTAYISNLLLIGYILPVLVSTLYCDKRMIIVTAALCSVLMLVSLIVYNEDNPMIGMYYGMTKLDVIISLIQVHYVPASGVYFTGVAIAYFALVKNIEQIQEYVDIGSDMKMYERDLSLASEIQHDMLPGGFPDMENCRMAASMKAAKTVGGDFYDCFRMDDGRIVTVMADVSGKGMPASLFMVKAMTLIRSNVKSSKDLSDAMEKANDQLFENNRMKYFVTVWISAVDPRTGTVEYVNAGHNPPFRISRGNVSKVTSKPDFVFGRKKNMVFHTRSLELEDGDRMFMFTDGVTEAVGPDGSMFGEERLEKALSESETRSPEEVLTYVSEKMGEFVKDMPQSDDITMMVMDYSAPDPTAIRVKADKEGHGRMMEHLSKTLSEMECPPSVTSSLEVACSEIFSNIDMYAYKDMDTKGDVEFDIAMSDDHITITFTDWGVPFDPL